MKKILSHLFLFLFLLIGATSTAFADATSAGWVGHTYEYELPDGKKLGATYRQTSSTPDPITGHCTYTHTYTVDSPYGLIEKADFKHADGYVHTNNVNAESFSWESSSDPSTPNTIVSIDVYVVPKTIPLSVFSANVQEQLKSQFEGWIINNKLIEYVIATSASYYRSFTNITDKDFTDITTYLSSAIQLVISDSSITHVPDSIKNMRDLEWLEIKNCWLEEFPIAILALQNLQQLHLENTWFDEVPESIGTLTNLTELSFESNLLTELPYSIGNLVNLTYLNFGSNQIETLPSSILNLKKLKYFFGDRNRLTSLPEGFGNNTNFTKFTVEYNQISSLPPSVVNLTGSLIDFSYNNLTDISPLLQLDNIVRLFIAGNNLSSLPDEFSHLNNLDTLSVYDNNLTMLPLSLFNATNLYRLEIGRNNIHSLPEDIGKLKNLTELYASYAQLYTLPESLAARTNLTIYASGVPFKWLPASYQNFPTDNFHSDIDWNNLPTSPPEVHTNITPVITFLLQ